MDGSQRDAHYRAIDRPTENGREEKARDNREENSFLLAKKGTTGAGKRRQSLNLWREETKTVNNDDINVPQRKQGR